LSPRASSRSGSGCCDSLPSPRKFLQDKLVQPTTSRRRRSDRDPRAPQSESHRRAVVWKASASGRGALPPVQSLATRIVLATPDRRDPPLALRVDIFGTVDHNMDEGGIPTTPSAPFPRAPKKEGRAAAPLVRCLAREPTRRRGFCLLVFSHAYLRRAPWARASIFSIRLPPRPRRRHQRRAAGRRRSRRCHPLRLSDERVGDFVVDGIRELWALTTMAEAHLDARH